MKQHTDVSDRVPGNLTDLDGRQFLDLAKLKHFPLAWRQSVQTVLGLVVEDAEQPGADLGPPLKPLNRLDKRHKDVLDEILGLVL